MVSGENAVKGNFEGKGDSGQTGLMTFLQKAGQGNKMAELRWRNLIESSGGQIPSEGKGTFLYSSDHISVTARVGVFPSTPAHSQTLWEPTGCPIIQS